MAGCAEEQGHPGSKHKEAATVFGCPVEISMSSMFAAGSQDSTVRRHRYPSKRSIFDKFYGSAVFCSVV